MQNQEKRSRLSRYILPVSSSAASAIFLITGILLHFHVSLNDFFGLLYYAKHLSFVEPASLYNGFFPIGYALLLRFIPYGYVLYFAYGLNILFGGMLVAWTISLFFRIRRSLGIALGLFITAILFPLVFRYANTAGPDMGLAALAMGAVYLLWKDEFGSGNTVPRKLETIMIGVFLGLSALWRYQGIIISVAILFSYAVVFGIQKLWARRNAVLVFVLLFLVQVTANLISGHAPLETAESFTVYITFHGMNWWQIPQDAYHFSLLDQLLSHPMESLSLYIPLLWHLVVYGVPALACIPIIKSPDARKYSIFATLTILLYSIPVAIGTSATDRAPLSIIGIALSCTGLLAAELQVGVKRMIGQHNPSRNMALMILAALVLGVFGFWLYNDINFIHAADQHHGVYSVTENVLTAKGMKSPYEVFTNDYDLYFPNTPPYLPLSDGGWEDVSLWGYRAEHPDISTDSWELFEKGLVAQHIKFLVLSHGAGLDAEFFQALYDGQFHPQGVRLISKAGGLKIYRLNEEVLQDSLSKVPH